jgi:hypothetical protein
MVIETNGEGLVVGIVRVEGETRTAVGNVERALNSGLPLELADLAVLALDLLPEPDMISPWFLGKRHFSLT